MVIFQKPGNCIGKTLEVVIDRPLGSRHPVWGFIYPVNYGHVSGILSPDGECLDAYVLGVHKPLTTFTGKCIALIQRADGDDKLVLVPEGMDYSNEQIEAITSFQEKLFHSEILR